MRLAFCVYTYFPFGGLQRNFLTIAEHCAAAGHEVVAFVGSWQGDLPEKIQVRELGHRGLTNEGKNRYFYRQLQKALQGEAFDLVVGFNRMPGLDLYYAADVCFADRIREKPAWLKWLNPRYRNYLAWEAAVYGAHSRTHILAVSAMQKPIYQRYYQTPDARFHLLPPGISPRFQPPENAASIREQQRSQLGLQSDEIALFLVGSGFRTKGLDRAIRALANLGEREPAHLFVVGQDNEQAYRQLARQLDVADRVHFLGGRNDLPDLLRAADVLVHPARFENTGNVLLEAVIAGIPVVCTAACGYAPYVEEARAGEVLPEPFSQQQFESSLQALIQGEAGQARRRKLSESGVLWGRGADIYRRYVHATTIIEQLAAAGRQERSG